MRSPIWRYGGKGNMVAKLLPLFPPCHTYVEPFGGGASLLLAKEPSPVEVYNDIDQGLVGLFRVLRDPDHFAEFQRLAALTPYARAEFDTCRAAWHEHDDPVKRAWAWFVTARQSFSGELTGGWSHSVTTSRRGMAGHVSKWLSTIDRLPELHARLMPVQIECHDWRTILDRYDRPETLFYLDPPYLHDTRKAHRYQHELTDDDHADLVQRLLSLQGMAVLSGYAHPIYQPLEAAGWTRHDWQTACYAAGRTQATGILGPGAATKRQPRIESAWVKPTNLPISQSTNLPKGATPCPTAKD